MKRLIYQVYVGKQSNLYDTCTNSVKRYCEKYDIDHVVQREPILKIAPDLKRTNRNLEGLKRNGGYLPIFEKENAFNYLNDYDSIAIIDSDIYIKKNASNIFDEFGNDHDFGGVIEAEMPINNSYKKKIRGYSNGQFRKYTSVMNLSYKSDTGYDFMNMGMMLLNSSIKKYLNNETPREFLARKEFKDFVDGVADHKWSTDQVLMNYWIQKEKMNIKRMNWKWNALYNAVEMSRIKEAYFVHFFLKDHLPKRGEDVKGLLKNVE